MLHRALPLAHARFHSMSSSSSSLLPTLAALAIPSSSSSASPRSSHPNRRKRNKPVAPTADLASRFEPAPTPDLPQWRQRAIPREVVTGGPGGVGRAQAGVRVGASGGASSRGLSTSARWSDISSRPRELVDPSELVSRTEGLSLGEERNGSTTKSTATAPRKPRRRPAYEQRQEEEQDGSSADESGPLLASLSSTLHEEGDLSSEIQRLYAVRPSHYLSCVAWLIKLVS